MCEGEVAQQQRGPSYLGGPIVGGVGHDRKVERADRSRRHDAARQAARVGRAPVVVVDRVAERLEAEHVLGEAAVDEGAAVVVGAEVEVDAHGRDIAHDTGEDGVGLVLIELARRGVQAVADVGKRLVHEAVAVRIREHLAGELAREEVGRVVHARAHGGAAAAHDDRLDLRYRCSQRVGALRSTA